jgi:hypothetical protein
VFRPLFFVLFCTSFVSIRAIRGCLPAAPESADVPLTLSIRFSPRRRSDPLFPSSPKCSHSDVIFCEKLANSPRFVQKTKRRQKNQRRQPGFSAKPSGFDPKKPKRSKKPSL